MDQRNFAQGFLKYKDDPNNFALYLWGYVDLMLDFYKNRPEGLISSDPFRLVEDYDTKSGFLNIYGEPDVYPQFAEKIYNSELYYDQWTDIYVISDSGELNLISESYELNVISEIGEFIGDNFVFRTRFGGTSQYVRGNTCEERIMKTKPESDPAE